MKAPTPKKLISSEGKVNTWQKIYLAFFNGPTSIEEAAAATGIAFNVISMQLTQMLADKNACLILEAQDHSSGKWVKKYITNYGVMNTLLMLSKAGAFAGMEKEIIFPVDQWEELKKGGAAWDKIKL